MAQAARAYRYNSTERSTRRSPAPDVRVVPGRRSQTDTNRLPSAFVYMAIVAAGALVVFALLGFVRIGLASATVSTAVEAGQISTDIESVRSAGNELEVRESNLTNPTYLKTEASKLHMGQAEDATIITLPEDVVKTDAEGNLSLSLSLTQASQG